MNDRLVVVLVVVVLLLASGGCLGTFPGLHGDRPWSLALYPSEQVSEDGNLQIHTEVGLDGAYQLETTVTDVRVCAVDEDGETIARSEAGTISGDQPRRNVSLTLQEPPKRLVLGYETVETDSSYEVESLERLGERRYRTFSQGEALCEE